MIWQPKPGQRVRLHYAERYRAQAPHHGRTGLVVRVAKGPGPISAEVCLDTTGRHVVVPRGNLVAE